MEKTGKAGIDLMKIHRISVMMSTYNGEKYLREQLDSILDQEGVDVRIYVRDDGSTDSTVEILNEYADKSRKINVIKGKNIGWKQSFLWLLANSPEDTEYYCFSDQDDVWKTDKLSRGISFIEQMGENAKEARCYCSKLSYVDENLKDIGYVLKERFETPNEYHCITNGFGMGCTLIFNKALLETLRRGRFETIKNISHDSLVSTVATYFGTIERDQESRILYRQHSSNAGSTKKNIRDRFSTAFDFNGYFMRELAKYMLDSYDNELSDRQKITLRRFADLGLLSNKIKLVFNRYVSRNTFFGTIKLKIYILITR